MRAHHGKLSLEIFPVPLMMIYINSELVSIEIRPFFGVKLERSDASIYVSLRICTY